MPTVWILILGGATGTLCRYYGGRWVQQLLGAHWPYGTLAVNLLGCLLMGVVLALSEETRWLPPWARILLASGFLGAFTTFSTFEMEVFFMGREAQWGRMTAYGLGSVVLGLGLVWLGYAGSMALTRGRTGF